MNVMLDTFGTLTNGQIFVQNFGRYLPAFLHTWLDDNLPNPKFEHVRSMAKLVDSVARDLIRSKANEILQGYHNKDIMTMLVQANASENPKTRMSEEELISQMRTILLAGHETTANTLSWMLLELACHPNYQVTLREEICAMKATISARGNPEWTIKDLDAMPYLNAFLKESLRMHPAALVMFREAARDAVLPLFKPIYSLRGETITELPIPKGLGIMASISNYNRNEDIFGDNAHVFDPSRWLDSKIQAKIPVGVIGNLMSFSAGTRSCIGWKFAVAELQMFIIELVGRFEFSLTPEAKKVKGEAALVAVPVVEGQVEKGAKLPLRVKAASRNVES